MVRPLRIVMALISGTPAVSAAAQPDPVNAVVLSAAGTAVPVAVAAGLLADGGADEGVRFNLSLAALGIGAAVGPSVGQFYAGGGTNAWVTLGLRAATGATMTTGLGIRLRGEDDQQTLGTALFWIGLVPTVLLGLYDIITVYGTASQARYLDSPIADQAGLTPELYSVAVCGPVPCAAGIGVNERPNPPRTR